MSFDTEPPFPREENFDDLTRGKSYSDGIRWRLFLDVDSPRPRKQVLITTDQSWTVLDGAAFRQLTRRILRQLDDA